MFKTLECRSPAVFGLYQQNRDQIVGNLFLQGEKNVQKTYKCIYSVNNFLSCIDVQCKSSQETEKLHQTIRKSSLNLNSVQFDKCLFLWH